MEARTLWPSGSQEAAVEAFYSHGANAETEIHGGYLNFGLWQDGNRDYLVAAESMVRRMATMLGLGPESRLLDVACGMSAQDVYLARRFGPLRIDAIDVTWRHVERGIRRIRDEGLADRVSVRHGSATDLPFAEATFSHVLGIEGPVHFLTRRRFLEEAYRVLRPGGVLALADYALGRRARGAVDTLLLEAARALWRVPRENFLTAPEYRQQLHEIGFRDPTVESAGAETFPGYYTEQMRPEFRREMERLQGRLVARVGLTVTVVADWTYRRGLVDYVLVRAEKPA